MTDSIIHSNKMEGSPIMSYGTSGGNSTTTKLLALLAGGFVVVLLGCFAWFWLATSVLIPESTTVWAVLPANTGLSYDYPAVWRKALDQNSPLPTLVGYSKVSEVSAPEPFAVEFPSLFSSDFYQTGFWKLSYISPQKNRKLGSPLTVFGWPWSAAALKNAQLTVLPRVLLNDGMASVADLPEKISGELSGRVWRTDLSADMDEISSIGLNASLEAKNIVSINAGEANILENYYAMQGLSVVLPTSAWFTWLNGAENTEISLIPEATSVTSSLIGLAQGRGLFQKVNYLLADQVSIEAMRSPVLDGSSSTQQFFELKPMLNIFSNIGDLNIIDGNTTSSTLDEVASRGCPGTRIAKFDTRSVSNMCTWIGMCLFENSGIVVMQENNHVVICF